jgi:hypothetical protein
MKVTAHLHLVPKLNSVKVYLPLLPQYAFMAWMGKTNFLHRDIIFTAFMYFSDVCFRLALFHFHNCELLRRVFVRFTARSTDQCSVSASDQLS